MRDYPNANQTRNEPIPWEIDQPLPWPNYALARALDASIGRLHRDMAYTVRIFPDSYDINLTLSGADETYSIQPIAEQIKQQIAESVHDHGQINIAVQPNRSGSITRSRKLAPHSTTLFRGLIDNPIRIQLTGDEPTHVEFNTMPVPDDVPQHDLWADTVAVHAAATSAGFIPSEIKAYDVHVAGPQITFFFLLSTPPDSTTIELVEDLLDEFNDGNLEHNRLEYEIIVGTHLPPPRTNEIARRIYRSHLD